MVKMSRKLTAEDFISKAKSIHGDKYDYPLIEFKNATTKVNIKCKTHGIFEQLTYSHCAGQGCPICAGLRNRIPK